MLIMALRRMEEYYGCYKGHLLNYSLPRSELQFPNFPCKKRNTKQEKSMSSVWMCCICCGCIGRRDTRNLQTGGGVREVWRKEEGKEGGEVGTPPHPFTSSSSVCLEVSVIFSPVKDDQTHRGSGEED